MGGSLAIGKNQLIFSDFHLISFNFLTILFFFQIPRAIYQPGLVASFSFDELPGRTNCWAIPNAKWLEPTPQKQKLETNKFCWVRVCRRKKKNSFSPSFPPRIFTRFLWNLSKKKTNFSFTRGIGGCPPQTFFSSFLLLLMNLSLMIFFFFPRNFCLYVRENIPSLELTLLVSDSAWLSTSAVARLAKNKLRSNHPHKSPSILLWNHGCGGGGRGGRWTSLMHRLHDVLHFEEHRKKHQGKGTMFYVMF